MDLIIAHRSDQKELKEWERGTLKLAALASLTGCPQVQHLHDLLKYSIPALRSRGNAMNWSCCSGIHALAFVGSAASLHALLGSGR